MGYAWQGTCYPDTATALKSFALSVPNANPSGINTFTAAPTVNASGLVTWSISNRPLSGTAATTRTGTTQLPTCTYAADNSFELVAVQDVLVASALAICFLIGALFGGQRS